MEVLAIISGVLLLLCLRQMFVIRKFKRLNLEHEVWREAMDDKIKDLEHQVKVKGLQIETDQNVIDKGISRCLQQGIEIEVLEQKLMDTNERCNNLVKSKFKLIEEINTLKKSIEYYKSRANHKKRPCEMVNSDWYEAKGDTYELFKKGEKYLNDKSVTPAPEFLFLFKNGPHTTSYLVEKKHFEPVKISE